MQVDLDVYVSRLGQMGPDVEIREGPGVEGELLNYSGEVDLISVSRWATHSCCPSSCCDFTEAGKAA